VATIEGTLFKAWRKSLGLTLEEVGARRRPPATKSQVGDVERRGSSMTVENLLSYIHALERASAGSRTGIKYSFGQTDQRRLAAFFDGPDERDARRAAATAARALADQLGDAGRE
jgi:pyrroloquinoline quinone (PQQ) biosynthesis protein C